MQLIISSDRSSYGDDVLVYIQLSKAIGPLVHWLIVKCHLSYVICHMSNVKSQMTNIKCQMPNVKKVKLLSEHTSGAPQVIFDHTMLPVLHFYTSTSQIIFVNHVVRLCPKESRSQMWSCLSRKSVSWMPSLMLARGWGWLKYPRGWR